MLHLYVSRYELLLQKQDLGDKNSTIKKKLMYLIYARHIWWTPLPSAPVEYVEQLFKASGVYLN